MHTKTVDFLENPGTVRSLVNLLEALLSMRRPCEVSDDREEQAQVVLTAGNRGRVRRRKTRETGVEEEL